MVLLSKNFVVIRLAAHSDADTDQFGLGGLNGGNHSGVGDFEVMGNGGFCNK